MKIGILLGSPQISGGTYVIYEHASRLCRRGHRVSIITREKVQPHEYSWHTSAHEMEWQTMEQAKAVSFDMVVATWWQSPFLLHELQSSHYTYFVQSIESRFFQPPDPLDYASLDNTIWQDLCEKTYSYAMPVITEASWIQEYIYQKYNNYPYLVRNGIRKDIYTMEGEAVAPRQQGRIRVLIEGPVDVTYKNVPASIKLARQAGADEIWLLTSSQVDHYDGVDRVFSQVQIHETPPIYRSCDLLLKLSYVEGMFGPPLEMFHCGGTALVYDVTGHDEYIVHDRNSYVVNRDNEEEVVQRLRYLRDNPESLDRLKAGARQTASSWPDWDECSGGFEKALLAIAEQRPASRDYFQRRTEELFTRIKPFLKSRTWDDFAEREKSVWVGGETDKNNYAELYWDGKGSFNEENSTWRRYVGEEWATVSFEVEAPEIPLWFRIDPSIRIGIMEIDSITLNNKTRGTTIMSFSDADEFQKLFLDGDLKWLFPGRQNIVFSFGGDPSIILPVVEESKAAVGDVIEVEMRVLETGVQQFFKEYRNKLSDLEPGKTAHRNAGSWWKRMFR